jgi:SAM-dependent methyltransferase
MKLSELVRLKNHLDSMSAMSIYDTAAVELNKINYIINESTNHESLFTERHNQIKLAFSQYETDLDALKLEIQNQIVEAEKPKFLESYRLHQEELCETAEYILNLRKKPNDDLTFLRTRLGMYADWHYAGMIIRPGTAPFINDMVAYDPLYIVDLNHEFMLPALSSFNQTYQNRLRSYTIKEYFDCDIFTSIPEEQFGMIFAYDFLNHRPFEMIKKYFHEVYKKLKPGGMFIFTFNDCDRVAGVELVEKYFASYTPGYLIRDLALSMGYEIVYSYNDGGPSTWLELKRPGVLESLKGGQTLGKIIPKSL